MAHPVRVLHNARNHQVNKNFFKNLVYPFNLSTHKILKAQPNCKIISFSQRFEGTGQVIPRPNRLFNIQVIHGGFKLAFPIFSAGKKSGYNSKIELLFQGNS